MPPPAPWTGGSRARFGGSLTERSLQSGDSSVSHAESGSGLRHGRAEQGRKQNGLGASEFFNGGGGISGHLRASHRRWMDVGRSCHSSSWHFSPHLESELELEAESVSLMRQISCNTKSVLWLAFVSFVS
jgi:hypothetical protein